MLLGIEIIWIKEMQIRMYDQRKTDEQCFRSLRVKNAKNVKGGPWVLFIEWLLGPILTYQRGRTKWTTVRAGFVQKKFEKATSTVRKK